MKSVCIFCGSSTGTQGVFAEAARALGSAVAEQGFRLVYGGGSRGLMGTLADAALAKKGEVVGVITRHLVDRELAHSGLSELQIVEDMHSRKAAMAALADSFVAMPGGFGTLEEMLEVLSWSQLGLHDKPVAFLEVDGFWQPLLTFFDHQVEAGFLPGESRDRVITDNDPTRLLERLASSRRDHYDRWRD
jgi:hypothetical protein